jgi:tetratricopeptide (TPR) repeat protein
MESAYQLLHLIFRKHPTQLTIVVALCVLPIDSCQTNAQILTRQYLEKEIQTYQALSTRAEPPSMEPVSAGRVWSHLGSLYEDAGMYAQSEMAYLHAIRLLRTPPSSPRDLARAIDDLGTLYVARGEMKLAEHLEQQALAIRMSDQLTADLSRSWYHLATLSLRERRDENARDNARRAIAQLETEPGHGSDDEMNARFVLGVALCRLRQYPEATLSMQNAMEIVRRSYRTDDFPTGFASFLLGYVDWKSGNRAEAQNLMQNGVAVVEKQLGAGHPVTLSVLSQYERFLRCTHQKKAAQAIDKHLKLAREPAGGWQGPEALSVASMF